MVLVLGTQPKHVVLLLDYWKEFSRCTFGLVMNLSLHNKRGGVEYNKRENTYVFHICEMYSSVYCITFVVPCKSKPDTQSGPNAFPIILVPTEPRNKANFI